MSKRPPELTLDSPSRRRLLQRLVFGGSLVGLRAVATGLPLPFLLNPKRALAAIDEALGERPVRAVGTAPQFLLLSTSIGGDPVNANVPGTYDDPNIQHPMDPSFAATSFTLGGASVRGAQIWSTLPAEMRARLCFFHHGTYTSVHPDERNVLTVMGAVNKGEMLPSMLAQNLHPMLGTLRAQPISLWPDNGEAISFQGSPLPLMTPQSLGMSIAAPTGPLGSSTLLKLRDQDLDAIHALVKKDGTPAQRAYVDAYATSREQLRMLQDKLLTALSGITDGSPVSQVKAAIALYQLKVTPTVVIHVPFGGDNHGDAGLGNEIAQHKTGIAALSQMWTLLQGSGLGNQVTFAMMNVFGRTLTAGATANGRDHNADHHVSLMMGPGVRGGLIGGVTRASGADYRAQAIDSSSGQASAGGDIPFNSTFAAMGQTLSRAVGLDAATVSGAFNAGTVVNAALA